MVPVQHHSQSKFIWINCSLKFAHSEQRFNHQIRDQHCAVNHTEHFILGLWANWICGYYVTNYLFLTPASYYEYLLNNSFSNFVKYFLVVRMINCINILTSESVNVLDEHFETEFLLKSGTHGGENMKFHYLCQLRRMWWLKGCLG